MQTFDQYDGNYQEVVQRSIHFAGGCELNITTSIRSINVRFGPRTTSTAVRKII